MQRAFALAVIGSLSVAHVLAQPTPPPRFQEATRLLGQAAGVAVGADGDLQERLRARARLLEQSVAAFDEVARGDDGYWASAAYFAIGRGFERFVESLCAHGPRRSKEVHRPSCVDAAAPLLERALEAYQAGLARAERSGSPQPWQEALREGVERLQHR